MTRSTIDGNLHVQFEKRKIGLTVYPRLGFPFGRIVIAAMLFAHVGIASTVYVDSKLDDYTGHDGSSWAKAFKTIQEGVDACGEGGTVYVAKGSYAEGGRNIPEEPDGYTNRVCITNRGVLVEGVDGAAETFIIGVKASADRAVDNLGNGPDAVRCLSVTANDIVVKGFTLMNGACHATVADENVRSADGGGFRSSDTHYRSCIVDCVVSNCVGVRAGAVQYGRAVRCLIVDNMTSKKASGGNNSRFLHCVFARNGRAGGGAICIAGIAVNCSFSRNLADYVGSESANFYNCVETFNGSVGSGGVGSLVKASNCVFRTGINSKGASLYSSIGASVTNASPYQFVNPMFCDFRLLSGCEAAGAGDAAYVSLFDLPGNVDRFRDLMGNVVPETGAIDVGAIQGEVEPEGGALQFAESTISVDGVPAVRGGEYVYAETYPTQFFVAVTPPSGKYIFAFKRTGYGYSGDGEFLETMADDTIWMMPPSSGHIYTNTLSTANYCYYVDPNLGNDGNDGTSPNAPFKTIQAAVNAAGTSRSVIRCAVGTYDSDDCVKETAGMTNRVSVTTDQTLRIVGAGAGKSIIKGALDESDPAHDGSKRGPAAMRCFASGSGKANILQGFTLADGRCGYAVNGTDAVSQHSGGGAFLGGSLTSNMILSDCVVTNCGGYRGAVYGGTANRCVFVDSFGYNGGVRYCRVNSSLFYGNPYDTGNKRILSSNSIFWHCTSIGMDKSSDKMLAGGIGITNSILSTIYGTSANSNIQGTFIGDSGATVSAGTEVDPQFIDQSSRDYGLLASSPCIGGGIMSDDYARRYSPGFGGDPILFVNGLPTAGAIQRTKASYVTLYNGRDGVVLSPAGTNALSAGESVTISFDGSKATRPISGFFVNGEEEEYSETTSWTFTAPPEGVYPTAPFSVQPIFSTNWYVNAATDVENGNGMSASSPKKTFHGPGGIFDECNVLPGDCVHVAPGTYHSGEGACDVSGLSSAYVNARCSVPAGVAVVADGGAKETFIVGADGRTGPVDSKGRGTNSVRCVYLRNASSVTGFTLTGGRTCGDGANNVNNQGGGVFAINNNGLIIDCVISNNASSRGGGMSNGKAIRCKFFDNWANKNRAAVSAGIIIGCVVDRNRGVNATQNTLGIWNCTFGPDNTTEDGTTATSSLGMPYGPVVNSVMCQNVQVDTSQTAYFTNCIFVTLSGKPDMGVYSNCVTAKADGLDFNADYSPVVGTNPAVDAGSIEHTAAELIGCPDANGGQRIYNGAIDIGAVEADWRDLYADALGKFVNVTSATENVTLSGGKVRLGDGDEIAGTWAPCTSGLGIRYSATAEVEGGCVLSGEFTDVSGNMLAAAEISSGMENVSFRGKDAIVGFRFGSVGEEGLLSSFMQKANAMVFVLR